ncbi:MAG TPA: hypothetical protein VGE59_03585 [Patescibacteria group bacterium]
MDNKTSQLELSEYRTRVEGALKQQFDDAYQSDQAEYGMALIKHANLSPFDPKDTLKNIEHLFTYIHESLLNKAIPPEESLRLFLLLYCHFFEWSEMYNLFWDLGGIKLGNRAGSKVDEVRDSSSDAWGQLCTVAQGDMTPEKLQNITALMAKLNKGPVNINKKIRMITNRSPLIGGLLAELFDNTLRNGFSHNNYAIDNSGLTIHDEASGKLVKYTFGELNLLINKSKSFAGLLISLWRERLSELNERTLSGKECEYKVQYRETRFRINLMRGSLPLGPEPISEE